MRIPESTLTPRWYVASSRTEGLSSWGSLLEAKASLARMTDAELALQQVKGIVENGPLGPRFVFIARYPINEHDGWVGEGEKSLLRSEIVEMARRQIATRDRWLKEMDSLPDWHRESRVELLEDLADLISESEKVLAEFGGLFPERS